MKLGDVRAGARRSTAASVGLLRRRRLAGSNAIARSRAVTQLRFTHNSPIAITIHLTGAIFSSTFTWNWRNLP